MTTKNNTGQPSVEKEGSAAITQGEVRTLGGDRLQTIEEVAQLIRFSTKSVYQLVHRRKIPYVKISGALRFNSQDIDAWIEGNTFRPPTKMKRQQISAPKAIKRPRKLTDVERLVEQSRTKYLDR